MVKVWLDAGHGGSDPGAVANGLVEKTMTLVTAVATKQVLEAHGVSVGMTRASDIFVGLSERASMANRWGADLFVSEHYNAGGGDGIEVIYSIHGGKGKVLARNIVDEITSRTGQNARPRDIFTKTGSDGRDYYAVIRGTNMDAVIVEGAFIDSDDRFIVDTVQEQQLMGVAVAYGILKTLNIAVKYSSSNAKLPTKTDPIPPKRKDLYRLAKLIDTADPKLIEQLRADGYRVIELPK